MNFEELNDTIPYVMGGKVKVLRMQPYPNITLAMPGRHAKDTTPKGGDYVVMVADPIWPNPEHQFTHDDIFNDVETKYKFSPPNVGLLMRMYLNIINGESPDKVGSPGIMPGIDSVTFFTAVQCLAVAEHRRYAQYENKYGGRFLPFRFAAGIAEGLWTAEAAISVQRKGRPGVEWLEKDNGVPKLTQELMARNEP